MTRGLLYLPLNLIQYETVGSWNYNEKLTLNYRNSYLLKKWLLTGPDYHRNGVLSFLSNKRTFSLLPESLGTTLLKWVAGLLWFQKLKLIRHVATNGYEQFSIAQYSYLRLCFPFSTSCQPSCDHICTY